MKTKQDELNRWRLVLGKYSEESLFGKRSEGFEHQQTDDLLSFIYDREYGGNRGGRDESPIDTFEMTVPEWVRKIRNIFPTEVVERLESEALDRYELTEILTDKKVLESMQPNMQLLKNILAFKNRMKGDVIDTAKRIVRQVVEELTKKLENDIKQSFAGKINRLESTAIRNSKNFDFKKTLRKNLRNYDDKLKTIVPHRLYFNPRIKRYNPWHIIIAIDQSGSMHDSVIYSAIMASIFSKLPILSIKLIVFNTQVVDLSGYVDDPVDVLMNVNLGGSEDIGRAMSYCETLMENPTRTIMVMITDLYDTAGYTGMYAATKRIIESGAKIFVLTGMDENSQGMIDKNAGSKMVGLGAKVATVTPNTLAEWIAESIQ